MMWMPDMQHAMSESMAAAMNATRARARAISEGRRGLGA